MATFVITLTLQGVYDYFCAPHEIAGMVGRLLEGRPSGPGTLPFGYFMTEGRQWNLVPAAAQRMFPSVDEILRLKVVRSPLALSS
jgi:plastocyanin